MAARGRRVVSADPLYRFDAAHIAAAVEAARPAMRQGVERARHRFVWTRYASPEALIDERVAVLGRFVADWPDGRRDGRNVAAALPYLPFPAGTFTLALVSHFLFTYSDHLNRAFHGAAVCELLRVAAEVRIFPLLDLDGRPSRHVAAVTALLDRMGVPGAIRRVPYELQKGGNRMLVARAEASRVDIARDWRDP
jgi:hypothetical protein